MKTIVTSRRGIEKENKVEETHIIISIRNPQSNIPNYKVNKNTLSIVLLEFDDLDKEPLPGSATYNFFGGKPVLFNEKMAEVVCREVSAHLLVEDDAVLVHCEAGISRSAGLAAAISKHFTGCDNQYFSQGSMYSRNPYRPNMLVYRIMLEVLNNIKEREIR